MSAKLFLFIIIDAFPIVKTINCNLLLYVAYHIFLGLSLLMHMFARLLHYFAIKY